MEIFVIIESEFRSLIRNSLEKVIGLNFKKKEDKIQEILLKISIRLVSSLLAVYIFNIIKKKVKIRIYLSYILLFIFFYFLVKE